VGKLACLHALLFLTTAYFALKDTKELVKGKENFLKFNPDLWVLFYQTKDLS
jgi:hypothetical protein